MNTISQSIISWNKLHIYSYLNFIEPSHVKRHFEVKSQATALKSTLSLDTDIGCCC